MPVQSQNRTETKPNKANLSRASKFDQRPWIVGFGLDGESLEIGFVWQECVFPDAGQADESDWEKKIDAAASVRIREIPRKERDWFRGWRDTNLRTSCTLRY